MTIGGDTLPGTAQAFENLRQFARRPRRREEHCELCNAEVPAAHAHLIQVLHRKLLCTCDACALLFTSNTGTRYKRVPRGVRRFATFNLTDAEWDALMIPINLAFFFQHSIDSRLSALYPSPAGATESLLPLQAWNSIVDANPLLRHLEPDVEALLVNRVGHVRGSSPADYYIVPIDACYKLVGLIRIHWRGFSGGTEVWQEIGSFFEDLRARSFVIAQETHA
ncbi:MAG TPA: DUF5947 family protein [Candidatus Solibacter sp.]|nr:DUF5947 family protein [Candidatus Solibacter sp.]